MKACLAVFRGQVKHVQQNPDIGLDCECSPSLIHCYNHRVGAFSRLNLPHLLSLPLSPSPTSPDPPVSKPDESKVRKTTSQYAAKRSAMPLRELWRGLSLSVALRDLACNSFL